MKLMSVTKAIERYWHPEDRPDKRSVIAAVRRGDIPGKIIGAGQRTKCWVDVEAFESTTGNRLADRILGGG